MWDDTLRVVRTYKGGRWSGGEGESVGGADEDDLRLKSEI